MMKKKIPDNEITVYQTREKVTIQKNGRSRGDLVWLVDFKNPKNNDFLVFNQFTVIENNVTKRPDVILFINGLPLAA